MAGLCGWTGTVLRVDLSSGEITKEPLNEEWARSYVGGRGVAARYLSEEVDPQVDPLSAANKLIFATGPLTGTNASCGARYMVVTKGPLTGAITTSNSGGKWGPELKFAGYDMIIIEGESKKPVYLWIMDDEVELRSAEHLEVIRRPVELTNRTMTPSASIGVALFPEDGQDVDCPCNLVMAVIRGAGPPAKPSRQPVMA